MSNATDDLDPEKALYVEIGRKLVSVLDAVAAGDLVDLTEEFDDLDLAAMLSLCSHFLVTTIRAGGAVWHEWRDAVLSTLDDPDPWWIS